MTDPSARQVDRDDPRQAEIERLAEALQAEFQAPVGVVEPTTWRWRVQLGASTERFPDLGDHGLWLADLTAVESVFTWESEAAGEPDWLGLRLAVGDGAWVLALVGFEPRREGAEPDRAGPRVWGPSCPLPALRAWGHEVRGRLAHTTAGDRVRRRASRDSGPDPAQLTERLLRRFRVSEAPAQFQQFAVDVLRDELPATLVGWLPRGLDEPEVVAGRLSGFEPSSLRAWLARVGQQDQVVGIDPTPGGVRVRLVVAGGEPRDRAGWLVAVLPDRSGPRPRPTLTLMTAVARLISAQRANAGLYTDIKELLFGVIRALTSAIDAKDPYTSGHSERVGRIAVRLGEQLGLKRHECGDLYLMGLLHDVGKIGIDDDVLKKPQSLTTEEYRQVQSHVPIGIQILSDLKKLHHLLPGVAHHHERYDGLGYPAGLAGDAIPLSARILAVADAYDAMSSSRPYRKRLLRSEIVATFQGGSGTQWDTQVVDALLRCLDEIEPIRTKGLGESLHAAVGGALGRAC
jgi:HD-GYP domain-containing protein (c-di-GMP phosphodiesterase class II)